MTKLVKEKKCACLDHAMDHVDTDSLLNIHVLHVVSLRLCTVSNVLSVLPYLSPFKVKVICATKLMSIKHSLRSNWARE